MHPDKHRFAFPTLLWAGLFLVAAVLAGLIAVDAQIKRGPVSGWIPENAQWAFTSGDFPGFWRQLGQAPYLSEAREDLRADLAGLALHVYRATGIRPTPLRYRVWMGNSLTAALTDDGAGICVTPGLLLYARMRGSRHPALEDGVRVFGDYYYAWRGNSFIAGTSAAYVRNAIKAGPVNLDHFSGPSLVVHHRTDPVFSAQVSPAELLWLSGYVEVPIPARNGPLTLANIRHNLLFVNTSRPEDMLNLAVSAGLCVTEIFPRMSWLLSSISKPVVEKWIASMPDVDWNQYDEMAVYLADVDLAETVPVPVGGLILRSNGPKFGPHPFETLAGDSAIPYEWQGKPGTLIPWLGEKLTLCLSGSERDWLVTTQEPAMAALLGAPVDRPLPADAYLGIDVAAVARKLDRLMQKAADLELLPGMNAKDVQARYSPRIQAAGRLGRLELFFSNSGNRTAFTGRFSSE